SHPQADAAHRYGLGRLVRRGLRSRRAVMHGLAGAVAAHLALHGGPGHLEAGGDFADRPSVINDELRDFQAVTWGKGSVRMRHGWAPGQAEGPTSGRGRPFEDERRERGS